MPNVISSNLRSADYDDRAAMLTIVFHHGGRYRYHGVPRFVYESLLRAPSKGTYFDAHIKDRYRFSRG